MPWSLVELGGGYQVDNRINQRRQAATANKVAAQHHAKRLALTDPLFNIREITKQALLLEDHLSHPYKLCADCVRKHLMTIEALAEEASAMDESESESGENAKLCEDLAEVARVWMEQLSDGRPSKEVAAEVRKLRKLLVAGVHDPRPEEPAARVASLYFNRIRCPHRT